MTEEAEAKIFELEEFVKGLKAECERLKKLDDNLNKAIVKYKSLRDAGYYRASFIVALLENLHNS